jgi:hypothetical protein
MLAAYYWLPFDRSSTGAATTILVIGLVLLIALIAGPADRRAPAPGRARGRSTEMRDVWATLICVRCWRVARRAAGGPSQRLSPALTPGPVPLSGAA